VTLHQLRTFRAVAHHRNLSRAAEQLHLTQPAVSMQMKELQGELGLPLLEVIGRRIHLTEAGELLEQYATRILGLVDEAAVALGELRGVAGRVRVGASSTPGVYLLPEILASYERAHPEVRVHFEVSNSAHVEARVAANELDFGVTGGAVTCSDVRAEPWGEDELVLVVGPEHPWAGAGRIDPAALAHVRLIAREAGSGTRQVYESELHRREVILPTPVELGGIEAVKRAVEAGLGVAILSRFSVGRELAEGRLHAVELEGIRLARPLVLIHHAQKRFASAALSLLEAVRRGAPHRQSPPAGAPRGRGTHKENLPSQHSGTGGSRPRRPARR
jgi:DNA-binding transcriptional LysR family regulator